MVTNVTNFSRSGLYDWMAQRVSAVVLAAYTLFLLGYVVPRFSLVFEGLGNGTFSIVSSFSNTGNAQATYAYNGGTSTGTLLIDSDGNGAADMKLTLLGGSAAALSASDFQWT